MECSSETSGTRKNKKRPKFKPAEDQDIKMDRASIPRMSSENHKKKLLTIVITGLTVNAYISIRGTLTQTVQAVH
jgi:hypothetical protein